MAAATAPARPTAASMVRRLDWTLELLVILLVCAETCVLYLVTEAAFSSDVVADRTVSPIWLFALLYLGTTIQRAMDAYRFFSPEYEVVSLVAIAALFLGAVRIIAYPATPLADLGWLRDGARALAFFPNQAARPVWGIVALVAYAWWRGRTRDEPSLESAYRIMRAGTPVSVFALLFTFAVAPTEADPALRRALFGAAIAFLACILAAIALGRLRIEHARGIITLTPRWLATFLGPVAGLVLGGTLLAGLFTRRFLDTLLWLLTPVFWLFDLILLILVYIATAFAWVVFNLFALLLRLLGPNDSTARPVSPSSPGPPQNLFNETRALVYPDIVRYLGAAALLGLIGWLLTRFLWRRRRQRPVAGTEERESVFSWGLLAENMADLLAGLTGRFGRKPDPLAHLRGDPRWRHTVAIRERYAQFLRRAAAAELPRAADQTPDEYAPVVADAGPARPAVAALTGRYDRARYDETPATAEDAAAAQAAWAAIEAAELRPPGRAQAR